MPYKSYYKNGVWHLENLNNGKVINVPSASSKEDADAVGQNRERFAHVNFHYRKGKGVKEHTRRI
jgi:hypothetical protein